MSKNILSKVLSSLINEDKITAEKHIKEYFEIKSKLLLKDNYEAQYVNPKSNDLFDFSDKNQVYKALHFMEKQDLLDCGKYFNLRDMNPKFSTTALQNVLLKHLQNGDVDLKELENFINYNIVSKEEDNFFKENFNLLEFTGNDSPIKLKGDDVLINGKPVGHIINDLTSANTGIVFKSLDKKITKDFNSISDLYRFLVTKYEVKGELPLEDRE